MLTDIEANARNESNIQSAEKQSAEAAIRDLTSQLLNQTEVVAALRNNNSELHLEVQMLKDINKAINLQLNAERRGEVLNTTSLPRFMNYKQVVVI